MSGTIKGLCGLQPQSAVHRTFGPYTRKARCASESLCWNSPDTNHRKANLKSQLTRAAKNSRCDQLLRRFD